MLVYLLNMPVGKEFVGIYLPSWRATYVGWFFDVILILILNQGA